jgi:hypothetical protein
METINFCGAVSQSLSSNQSVPDGARVSGTITFNIAQSDILYIDNLLTVSSNGNAVVTVNVNGTVSNYQGIEVTVDLVGGSDLGGQHDPSDILEIYLGPSYEFTNGIEIYCGRGDLRTPSSEVSWTDPTWMKDRLPYPVDYAVRIDGLVAPLSVYGLPPVLAISQTNDCALISYPADDDGYVLQCCPQAGESWQDVTNAPISDATNFNVTLPVGSNSMFFRLRAK